MQPRETLKLSLASSKNVLGRKEEESLKSQILEQSTIDIQPFFAGNNIVSLTSLLQLMCPICETSCIKEAQRAIHKLRNTIRGG